MGRRIILVVHSGSFLPSLQSIPNEIQVMRGHNSTASCEAQKSADPRPLWCVCTEYTDEQSPTAKTSSVTIGVILRLQMKGLSYRNILLESNILNDSVLIMCSKRVDLRRKLVDRASSGSGTVRPEQQRIQRSTARIESMVPRPHYILNDNQ